MSDLVEELKDAALTVNASSVESGCAECGMNSSLMENAADEIYRLRAKLERAREALEDIENADANTDVWKIAHSTLRELDHRGGGDE